MNKLIEITGQLCIGENPIKCLCATYPFAKIIINDTEIILKFQWVPGIRFFIYLISFIGIKNINKKMHIKFNKIKGYKKVNKLRLFPVLKLIHKDNNIAPFIEFMFFTKKKRVSIIKILKEKGIKEIL